MAAGDFSATQLMAITLRAQQMWTTNTTQTPEPNTVSVRTVLANQNARVADLEDKEKDKSVKITWVNACAIEAQDCTPDCSIVGEEISSSAIEYSLDLCKEVTFSVNQTKFRTNTLNFDDVAAPSLNMAINALDEWYNRQMLVKLKAFSGVNGAPAPWTYAGNTTTIPLAQYNRKAVANIIFQSMLNKFTNPYFINNGDLYVDWLNAQLDAGNQDGKGDQARLNAMQKMVFDLTGFSQAGLTESIFVVNPAAIAMATKARNPQVPLKLVDVTQYTVPSRSLPGVTYDAFYQIRCEVINGETNYLHSWKLKTRGGIFKNPEGCPVTIGNTTFTPTGVMSYTKGA